MFFCHSFGALYMKAERASDSVKPLLAWSGYALQAKRPPTAILTCEIFLCF